jgi:hypothetical protein
VKLSNQKIRKEEAMLHIYYARENIDKDKFLYGKIGEVLNQTGENNHQKILLLVPEQFTLQAERNAFEYLGDKGLIDLEVMSQSRLGLKVLSETGGTNRTTIDKYGRHMLLTKILTEENDRLEVYSGMNQKSSFIEMTNNLISEMKQFNTYPEALQRILEETGENPILNKKLKDIHKIYVKYEELIAGKYLDTEDYLNLFIEKIKHSKVIQNAVIWISGFDYLTPKTLNIVEQLMLTAKEVSIMLTADREYEFNNEGKPFKSRDYDLFDLTRNLMKKLKFISEKNGIKYEEQNIMGTGLEYESYISGIGRNLFYTVAASYLTIYLGVLFMVIANTVIGLKYLMQQRANKHRYITLLMLGANVNELRKSARSQIRLFFALTLSVAVCSSIFAIWSMFTSFLKLPVGTSMSKVVVIAGISAILFVVIECIYIHIVEHASSREIQALRVTDRG